MTAVVEIPQHQESQDPITARQLSLFSCISRLSSAAWPRARAALIGLRLAQLWNADFVELPQTTPAPFSCMSSILLPIATAIAIAIASLLNNPSSPVPPGPALASSLARPPHHHQSQANSATRLPEQFVSGLTTYWMASSEVDQKFLGRLARAVEHDNPLLSSMLFKILGLSLNLAEQLVAAKKQRKPTPVTSPLFLRRILHILWLSREGLVMLQQYVIPMVGNYVELKVLAYKLRASFHHIFVLFHNSPPVSTIGSWTPEAITAAFAPIYKDGHGLLGVDGDPISRSSSVQPTHALEGGPVGPPPGFETQVALLPPSFLLPEKDYLPTAHEYFREAMDLADQLLWGSHSLRLSVKTEYAAFLYECVHDAESSRQLAKKTVAEVYDATEGMDDDMFRDACELVTVLGKMMKRGLVRTSSSAAKGKRVDTHPSTPPTARSAPGMENAI